MSSAASQVAKNRREAKSTQLNARLIRSVEICKNRFNAKPVFCSEEIEIRRFIGKTDEHFSTSIDLKSFLRRSPCKPCSLITSDADALPVSQRPARSAKGWLAREPAIPARARAAGSREERR